MSSVLLVALSLLPELLSGAEVLSVVSVNAVT